MIRFLKDESMSSEKNRILRVHAILSENGRQATVSCDVISQKKYDFYFIYDLTEEEFNDGMQLDDLLEEGRSPHIVETARPHEYTVSISKSGTRCVAYLGRFDAAERVYFLLDQTQGNVSSLLKIQPIIRCQVRYAPVRAGILRLKPSDLQKAIMTVSGDMPPIQSCLTYCCEGAGREHILYGVDLSVFWKKELEIIIKKTERVRFVPPEDHSYRLIA